MSNTTVNCTNFDEIVNYYVKSLSPKVFEEIISNKTKDTPISCYIIVKTLIDVQKQMTVIKADEKESLSKQFVAINKVVKNQFSLKNEEFINTLVNKLKDIKQQGNDVSKFIVKFVTVVLSICELSDNEELKQFMKLEKISGKSFNSVKELIQESLKIKQPSEKKTKTESKTKSKSKKSEKESESKKTKKPKLLISDEEDDKEQTEEVKDDEQIEEVKDEEDEESEEIKPKKSSKQSSKQSTSKVSSAKSSSIKSKNTTEEVQELDD